MIRVIPSLLLSEGRLVKTLRFSEPRYVGDPINAVKIFNDKEADELMFLDISAARRGGPDFALIRDIATEAFMPFAYGGGIATLAHIEELVALGVEKVVLNGAAVRSPQLVGAAAEAFGSQAIVVSMDVKSRLLGGYEVMLASGKERTHLNPVEHARRMEELGAGEIVVNSIDRDGTQAGYDLKLLRSIADSVRTPVVALGGAGNLQHLKDAVAVGGVSAVSAGSLFVFHGKHRAVLITYPERSQLEALFN